jgi:hypothetical protein
MAVAAIAATLIATCIYTTALAKPAACDGFKWGGQGKCWTQPQGEEFAGWLTRHGSSPPKFKSNYPELAATFGPKWGDPQPEPYWRTCVTGYQCARAVIGHYFGGDIGYEMSIVSCETGGTFSNRAVGAAGELGWWQIHPIHRWAHQGGDLFDVRYNTRVAYRLSKGGTDFSPWTCA